MTFRETCGSKVIYHSKEKAKDAMKIGERIRGSELRVYKCALCGLWHLSSERSDHQKRILSKRRRKKYYA